MKKRMRAAAKGTLLRIGFCQYGSDGAPRKCWQMVVGRGGRLSWKKVSAEGRLSPPKPALDVKRLVEEAGMVSGIDQVFGGDLEVD
jgi:hypothetical protein